MPATKFSSEMIVRLVLAILGVLVCFWGIWNAGRAGLSRLLSEYAFETSATPTPVLSAANEAVQLAPADPDAHYNRAVVLWSLGRTAEAVAEYERAAALRPRDYYLWMVLGNSRDQMDDEEGAVAALREAVRAAPYYASPRWQLGNVLFRAGQRAEGFGEMRRAALSDQTFLPNMIDLAWGATDNDAAATQSLIRPESRQWRLSLAHFLARKGKAAEALNLARESSPLTEAERHVLVNELLAAKGYAEAYEVWAGLKGDGGQPASSGAGHVTNGDFENQLSFDETGFGWQFSREQSTVRISLDSSEPRSGAHSLRLDWNGTTQPNAPIISQLVLVEPDTRYRLNFAVRTHELVSGGLPLIILTEQGGSENRALAEPKLLPKGSNGWRDYSIEFATRADARAVLISLQRENCEGAPCPIFGRLWLDNFSLQKL